MATDQARYKFMRNWRRANLQVRDGIVSGTIDGKRFEDGPLDEFLDRTMEQHGKGGAGAAARTNVGSARRTTSTAGAGGSRSGGTGGAGRTGSKSKAGATRTVGRPRKTMAGTT